MNQKDLYVWTKEIYTYEQKRPVNGKSKIFKGKLNR